MWVVYTPVEDLFNVVAKFEEAKLPISESKIAYVPKTKKNVSGRDAEVCMNLAEALDDHDDVQNVFSDFDVSDEELARITG
mgnify:FL=1